MFLKSRQIGLTLALAAAEMADVIQFGDGIEIALARSAEGEAAPALPEWIQLLPAGPAIVARDGRSWKLSDPAVVVARFKDQGIDIPLDLEHASELLAPQGHPAPAQAWIKALAARDDGTVWGQVDWTDAGAANVRSRSYRYVSPAMLHDEAGNITGLNSAGLVTRPALTMPALAGHGRKSTNPKEPSMNTVALATLAGALSLASTASEAEILTAITANAASARDLKDLTKFVPAADLAAAQTRATLAEGKLADKDKADALALASTLVDTAVADGKIPPASRDHYLALAQENLEGVTTALAGMPKILTPPTKKDAVIEGGDANGLTPEQVALCAQLGTDPKAFAATLKEQG